MKAAPFEYVAPERAEEALTLLGEFDGDARVLAGGQSLVPLLALRMARVGHLVDVNRTVELRGIEKRDGELVIGATTRQAAVGGDDLVARHARLLAQVTPYIGHPQIRNRGTIGGSIAHADPTAEYPAALLALDAGVEIANARSRRRVHVDEILKGPYMTTIAPDELLMSIHVPIRLDATGSAVREIARRPGDFALVGGVAVVGLGDDGTIEHVRVVLFGVGPRAIRLCELEEELLGRREEPADLDGRSTRIASSLTPPSDVQATSDYRRRVAGRLAASLVRDALADARRRCVSQEVTG
jgi:aerobic carbon-monoxide dehydrogenase medium subunit